MVYSDEGVNIGIYSKEKILDTAPVHVDERSELNGSYKLIPKTAFAAIP